ncbi:hypothetical protein HanPI659440_Chr14g0559271 [Helianthus annuus]|nr:hypothetical protein HanPI659440_Chr14g0559271 [Helianthus annuus]
MVVQRDGVVMVRWCGGAGSDPAVTRGVEAVAVVVVWRCGDGRLHTSSRSSVPSFWFLFDHSR